MDPPKNTTVIIHEGGDVTLVCRERPTPSQTPIETADDISTSAAELTFSTLPQAAYYSSASTEQPSPSPSVDLTTANDSANAGTPTRSLVVSSHVPALTSHYFKRMLDTLMTEGIEFARTGRITIPLPEDDAEAMTTICNIIHHRNTLVQPEVDLSFLHDIAVVSDKCDFNEALKPTVTTWVHDYVSDLGEDPNLINTAFFRTPAGNPNRTARELADKQWMQSRIDVWSKMLICAHSLKHHRLAQGPMRSLILGCDLNTQQFECPPKLLNCLREAQRSASRDACNIVADATFDMLKEQAFHAPICTTLIQPTRALMYIVIRGDLRPWREQDPCNLEVILSSLEDMRLPTSYMPKSQHGAANAGTNCRLPTGPCDCESEYSPDSVVMRIRKRAAALRESINNIQVEF